MLRGISTLNLWADDLDAAARWYADVLGQEPYTSTDAEGEGVGYVGFRIGEQELGIVDRRYTPPELREGPCGPIAYWHVDDVPGALQRLVDLGARELEPMRERGDGLVTASVVDPFGNALGLVYSERSLDTVLGGGPSRD